MRHVGSRTEWTLNKIEKAVMVSPSGTRVTIGNIDESFILDREKMDGDLAAEAAAAGAKLLLSTTVTEIRRTSDGRYECITSPDRPISAACIIIADGVESRCARFLGWHTAVSLADMETCAFCHVASPLIEPDACVFYTGTTYAPGGYVWIFPRGKGIANVGLGINGSRSAAGKAKELLLKFIDKELPGSHISYLHCGGVPVAKAMRPLVRDGAMLVGDAARQVNCMSGAGIHYSLYAGKTAGTIAANAFKSGSFDQSALKEYEKAWWKTYGKQQMRSFALKEFVLKSDDAFLDRIALSLSKEPSEKMNYLRVFIRTFARNPLLLIKAIRLFG
jgi:digeranylgeranylglycerophospholipid reductase